MTQDRPKIPKLTWAWGGLNLPVVQLSTRYLMPGEVNQVGILPYQVLYSNGNADNAESETDLG